MALQTPVVELAFTATPFADPSTLTWTDVSAYALAITPNRGKADEQSSMQAGTLNMTLDNYDGRFDPTNSAGPYFGSLLPGIPVRISTVFSATTYRLFYGFIDSFEQHYDGMLATCQIVASDGINALSLASVGLGYTETLVSDYGGTIGTAFEPVWPFQGTTPPQYYLGTPPALVADAGATFTTEGVAQTCLQLSGSPSYFYWLSGDPGAQGYWAGAEGWLRIDTLPTGIPRAMLTCCNGNGTATMPNMGFNPTPGDDAASVWLMNYPANILGATLADPTTTTGWSVTGAGASLATATITSSNGQQRIYLDNGATDFYGATKAMRLTCGASGVLYDALSPFTNCSAATAMSFSAVFTQEGASTANMTLQIDWYNGASFLSSTGVAITASATQMVANVTATSPGTATKFQWHITGTPNAATQHYDVAQMIAVAGTYPSPALGWWAGGTTPTASLLFVIGSGRTVAPPGQTAGAYGWPCYGTAAIPTTSSWFHVAMDKGEDDGAAPYTSAATRMPSTWLNGASVRMWTTGTSTGGGWASSPGAAVGAKVNTTPTEVGLFGAMSADELYIADGSITAAGEVTAAKALAHYTYGLRRHDFIQQLTGARINAVLDGLSWPTSLRSIDTGSVTVLAELPATTATSASSAQQLITDAVTAEGGLFFIGADGTAHFWGQSHAMGSSVLTIGDGATDVHYMSGLVLRLDDTHIYNQVQLSQDITDGSATTAAAVTASDATSQGLYGLRALQLSAPWESTADMATLAADIIADYKTPVTRVAAVSVEGVTSNAFASLLPREIGDLVTVHVIPANYTGSAITVAAYIQGVGLAIAQNRTWTFTFSLTQTLAGH